MLWIIYWIIWVLFESVWTIHWKKAINSSTLSWVLFKTFSPLIGLFVVFSLIFFKWFNHSLFSDYTLFSLLLLIVLVNYIRGLWEQNLMKKLKLSDIMPYDKLDKVFVIIIGFLLYSGTEKQTSFNTLFISIFTVFIILLFTVDFKNIKFPKYIGSFIFLRFLKAFTLIWTWYILLSYDSITYVSVKVFTVFILSIISILILKQSIKPVFEETREFYFNRILWTIISRFWFIIWLFIIEKQWVVIATLLWFLWLVFNVFAMKFILKDNPNKKQLALATIVTFMIWLWYYFK